MRSKSPRAWSASGTHVLCVCIARHPVYSPRAQSLYKHERRPPLNMVTLLLPLLVSFSSLDCSESRQPWWLPGKAVPDGHVAPVYGHPNRRLLCCDGKLGGIPSDLSLIADWKVHQGEQFAVLGGQREAQCAQKQEFPPPRPRAAASEAAGCPKTFHFPPAPLKKCSGAFNPLSLVLEFAKCCDTTKMGESGEVISEGTGLWVYPTQESCRVAECPPPLRYECDSASLYAINGPSGAVCQMLPDIKKFRVEERSSCGWDDLEARMGSSESLAECLGKCASSQECVTVEYHIGKSSHCLLRSETCSKRTNDMNVHTYIKKTTDKHSNRTHSPQYTLFIVVLVFAIVGLLLLGALLFFNQ